MISGNKRVWIKCEKDSTYPLSIYRLDAYTQNMLILFHQLLGKDFWNFVVIVFTHVDEDFRDDLEDNMDAVTASNGKIYKNLFVSVLMQ